jgi:hypothetical protein
VAAYQTNVNISRETSPIERALAWHKPRKQRRFDLSFLRRHHQVLRRRLQNQKLKTKIKIKL